jgi:ribosomal-protein-alanine acetyltransferase/tRNA threonylcarbamoyl adenosine modification protein YeaZ
MLILAIDSASDHLKIGLADEQRILGSFDGPPDRSHSEKIVVALDSLLRKANVAPPQLDLIAVATGPGSFTGLRIGIATVLGLAEAWNKPIIGATNAQLATKFYSRRGLRPVLLFHCRADQFYVADNGAPIYVDTWKQIRSRYQDRTYAGTGVEKLLRGGEVIDAAQLADPLIYSAGELAQMVAQEHDSFERLNPVKLDVNYFLKSQPEQKREQAGSAFIIDDMIQRDLPDITRIEEATFADCWTEENFRSDMNNPHTITLAARKGTRCVGYAVCIAIDEYGYIANIAVDKELRSQGVGAMLLKELADRLKKKKIQQIVLDVRISNIRAIEFYKEHGFTILTRREGFYSSPPEDSYTMLRAQEEE